MLNKLFISIEKKINSVVRLLHLQKLPLTPSAQQSEEETQAKKVQPSFIGNKNGKTINQQN